MVKVKTEYKPKMFFHIEDNLFLFLNVKVDRSVVYELYEEVKQKDGTRKKVKKIADEEYLWQLAYNLENAALDFFEKRRKPIISGISEGDFISMKHREKDFGSKMTASSGFYFSFLNEFAKKTASKYKTLLSDYLLYNLDYHEETPNDISIERISAYVDNCIARKKAYSSTRDTISALKNLWISKGMIFKKSEFDALQEQAKELKVEKQLFKPHEIEFYKMLFDKNVENSIKIINEPVAANEREGLGKFIYARRSMIRRINYRLVTELFLNYQEMENLKKEHYEYERKLLFVPQINQYIRLNDELNEDIKQYLEFRTKYDFVAYEEKVILGILGRGKIKTPASGSVDWVEFLMKSEVAEIKDREDKISDLQKRREECRVLGMTFEYKVNRKGIKEPNESELQNQIYDIIYYSEKRKTKTKETFIDIDDFFISINNNGMQQKGLRDMIQRFFEKEEFLLYKEKKTIEEFVDTNIEIEREERRKKEEYVEMMDKMLDIINFSDKNQREEIKEEVKKEANEEHNKKFNLNNKEVEYEQVPVFKDYTLLRESAIIALKNSKYLTIDEIEKRLRKRI